MIKKINALKARHRLGEMLESVYYKNEQFIITRGDKPMAAVIPLVDFEAFQRQKQADFKVFTEIKAHNRKVKSRQLEKDIDAAIEAVRFTKS